MRRFQAMNRAALMRLSATFLLAGVPAASALSAEYFIDPLVRISGLYETNPRLADDNERDTGGGVLDVSAEFGARSPVSLISVTPRFQTYRYKEDSLDRTDRLVDLTLERALTENLKVGLTGLASRLSTLVSEADDSGITGRRDRDRYYVSPTVSWKAGVRDRFSLTYSFEDTSYNEGETRDLVDYDYQVATLVWSRQWTQFTEGYSEVFGSEYGNQEADCTTESVGGRLGLNVKLSPTLLVGGSAGYVTSDTDFESFEFEFPVEQDPGEEPVPAERETVDCRRVPVGAINVTGPVRDSTENDSFLASVKLQKNISDISAVTTGFDRSVAASGRGIQTIRDRVSITWTQALSERTRFSLGGNFQTNESDVENGRVRGRRRDTIQMSSDLRYRLSEESFVGIGYRYRHRKDDQGFANVDGSESENHTALIFFDYDLKARTLLR